MNRPMSPAQRGIAPVFLARDWPCLDGLSWPRMGWLLLICAGVAIYTVPDRIFFRGAGFDSIGSDYVNAFLESFARRLIGFTSMFILLSIADAIPVAGARRVAVLALAVIVGAQVAALLKCILPMGYACVGFWDGGWRFRMFTEDGMWTLIIGGLLAIAFFARRHDLRVAEALHQAELKRADMQRRTLGANLHAMQARVEPGFLFTTLGAIDETYARDHDEGERMLDRFIAYLRLILPDVRGARSTLGREVTIAQTYASIMDMRAGRPPVLTVDAIPDAGEVAVPPMLFLPLLTAVLAAGGTSGELALHLKAATDSTRVRIALTGTGIVAGALAGSATVRDVRERLRALYGERATFAIDEHAEGRFAAVMEFPREDA